MTVADINNLHGAALRRAFDEARLDRGLDPTRLHREVMKGLFLRTAEELVREWGPDWYDHME